MGAELREILNYFEAHDAIIFWSSLASILTFVGTLISVPWLITKIPADYFISSSEGKLQSYFNNPFLRILGIIFKNIFGYVFIINGFIMLFIPGQGLLTMIIGLVLIDFPRKKEVEYRIVKQPMIHRTINKIRKKAGKPEIKI